MLAVCILRSLPRCGNRVQHRRPEALNGNGEQHAHHDHPTVNAATAAHRPWTIRAIALAMIVVRRVHDAEKILFGMARSSTAMIIEFSRDRRVQPVLLRNLACW